MEWLIYCRHPSAACTGLVHKSRLCAQPTLVASLAIHNRYDAFQCGEVNSDRSPHPSRRDRPSQTLKQTDMSLTRLIYPGMLNT